MKVMKVRQPNDKLLQVLEGEYSPLVLFDHCSSSYFFSSSNKHYSIVPYYIISNGSEIILHESGAITEMGFKTKVSKLGWFMKKNKQNFTKCIEKSIIDNLYSQFKIKINDINAKKDSKNIEIVIPQLADIDIENNKIIIYGIVQIPNGNTKINLIPSNPQRKYESVPISDFLRTALVERQLSSVAKTALILARQGRMKLGNSKGG